jgi:hypothetical protein
MRSYDEVKREWKHLATKHTQQWAFDFPEWDDKQQTISGTAYVFAMGEVVVAAEIALTWTAASGLKWTIPNAPSEFVSFMTPRGNPGTTPGEFIGSMCAHLQENAPNAPRLLSQQGHWYTPPL